MIVPTWTTSDPPPQQMPLFETRGWGSISPPRGTAVHVWWVDIARENPCDYRDHLNGPESEQAARLCVPRARRDFIVTRGVLRCLIGGYLGLAPAECEIRLGRFGKPRLLPRFSLSFNVSHSGDRAVLAFCERASIGVDVERQDDRIDVTGLSRCFFSAAEARSIAAMEAVGAQRAFFDCWTRKEAFVKAVGDGLSHDLASFTVSTTGPAALLSRQARKFALVELDAGRGYSAALAVRRRGGAPIVEDFYWTAM